MALVSALSILGVAASATPAAAKISEHGTEHRSFINVYENYCGDMTVRIDLEDDVMVIDNSHGPDGLVYPVKLTTARSRTPIWQTIRRSPSLSTTLVTRGLKVTDNVTHAHHCASRVHRDFRLTGSGELEGLNGEARAESNRAQI